MAFQILTLTDAAREHIQKLLKDKADGSGLRISIKKGGCAGMEYDLSIQLSKNETDDVIEQDEARIFIDPAATLFLLGTTLDYEETKFRSGLVFHNPNQISACGCGESVELVAAKAP